MTAALGGFGLTVAATSYHSVYDASTTCDPGLGRKHRNPKIEESLSLCSDKFIPFFFRIGASRNLIFRFIGHFKLLYCLLFHI